MNFMIAKTIFYKELLDTFRDKRTMITMIGLPIILYPAIFIISIQMAILQQSKMEETVSKIAVFAPEDSPIHVRLSETEQLEILDGIEDAHAALEAGDIDAIVELDETFDSDLAANESAGVSLFFDRTEPPSREAEDRIDDALSELNEELLSERIAEQALPEGFATPIAIDSENVATASKASGTILGTILPLIMVVMLGLGAFYPAMDLTAGEKERGTFETLLSTPASKLEIVIGKFLAVFTLSMLTGFLNLASLSLTFYFQFSQLLQTREIFSEGESFISISPTTILGIAVIIIPLAFFISAIMMSAAVLARSFKEAQNYVSPVFILLMLPATAVSFPGIELNATNQFIPITNICLIFRDLITGRTEIQYFFTVFICTCVYAAFALVIATWMFQREEVILSEDKGVPLTLNRNAFTPSPYPTAGTSLGIFAIVMLLLFYVGSYAQGKDLHTGLVITQYLLILLPVVLILRYIKVDLRTALNLRAPAPLSVLAVIIAVVPWVLIVIQLGVYHNRVLPIPEEFKDAMGQLFEGTDLNVGMLLLIIAVSPAICEEVLFRGVITSGFRRVLPAWTTILLVGLLFGLFHLSIYRVVLTGLSGVLFTYFVVRSGSIFLPMLGHFILNGLAILLETGTVPEFVNTYIADQNIEETGVPITWFVGAIVMFGIGIALFELTLPDEHKRRL